MTLKKIILFFIFTVLFIRADSQTIPNVLPDSCIALSFKVSITDQKILIKPFVSVTCSGLYQILKLNRFDQEFVADCDGKIFVERLVGGFWIAQTMWKLPGQFYDDSTAEKRILINGNNWLNDFDVTDLMPFEKDRYRLKIQLNYFHDNKTSTIKSADIEFDLKKDYPFLK